MKACKGAILFCLLVIFISACFNPPEFSNIPEIDLDKIQFKETTLPGQDDTLVLYLNFKDGDGDLGLDPDFNDPPFNDSFYFLADGTGDTLSVTTEVVYSSDGTRSYDLLNMPSGVTGKLTTNKTRTLPNYGYLPVYDPDPDNCLNYSIAEILVAEEDNVVDATYNIIDTLYQVNNPDIKFFLVQEPFLYKRNIYTNNIDVKFYRFLNGDYVEYNWFQEFCIDFNGRFPYINNDEGAPVEGTIRYAMQNSSFLAVFGNTPLKLKIKIRDRALNTSREIETPPFALRSKK